MTHTLLENTDSSGATSGEPLGRRMQVRRRQTPKFSIFYPGAVGHNPNHRHRQHQPMPGYSNRVRPSGVFPLPSNPFQGAKAQFDPNPQTVPTNPDTLRWQVGQQDPRFGLVILPHHHQNPTATHCRLLERRAGSYPPMARSWHQCAGGQTAAPKGLEGGIVLDPHERVPAQVTDAIPETGTPQSTIGQHQYRHALGDHRPQQCQEVHSRSYPRAGPITRQDMPCDWDGATAVEHADYHSAQPVTMGGRVNGQSQLIPTPPAQQPPKQRCKAKLYLQLGPARRGLIPTIVKPLSQILSQGLPSANSQQDGDHRVLAGAAGQDCPVHPKGKTSLLGRPEAGKIVFNRLLHLITFSWKAHGTNRVDW